MKKLHRWLLKRIAKEVVIQGDHQHNITEYYGILVDAARIEFSEDNKPTLDYFLKECHEESLKRELCYKTVRVEC